MKSNRKTYINTSRKSNGKANRENEERKQESKHGDKREDN